MTTLRTAAQQALEALQLPCSRWNGTQSRIVNAAIDALRAALAEPDDDSLTAAYMLGRYNAKKAEQEPVAWMHVPHPGNGISPIFSLSPQREPSLYAASVPLYISPPRCPNCASLEEQNTELDRRLADLEKPATLDEAMAGPLSLAKAYENGWNAAKAEQDLSRCPRCGGPADNGHDRSIPPNPYYCTKCMEQDDMK